LGFSCQNQAKGSMLIVEDDSYARDSLRMILMRKYPLRNLHVAESGRAGLELFQELKPEIVMTDLRMPGMSGIAMVKAIRQLAPETQIIVITAHSDTDLLQDCVRIDVSRYLLKPIDKEALFEAVDDCLSRIELERKVKAQYEELGKKEEQLRLTLESANLGAWDYRLDTGEVFWDECCRNMYGLSEGDRIDFRTSMGRIHPEDRDAVERAVGAAVAGINSGNYHQEFRIEWQDGSVHWIASHGRVYFDQDGVNRFIGANQDITERKKAETYRDLAKEVLQVLNQPEDFQNSIKQVLAIVKLRTRFDAVAIRLKAGEDFPYFAQEGLPQDFLLSEFSLVRCAASGKKPSDKEGETPLECTCGLVVSGKIDRANPLCSPGGSFFTNDSSLILAIPAAEDPRVRPRNRCIHAGYASFALVPIREKDRIVGLIQFNDRHKGCFTLETIELLEGVAAKIGAALMRKKAEEERLELEAQLRQAVKMESVGQLAGGVAHDFNNMLSVILGHANLVLAELDPTQLHHANLEEIRKAAERSADLTRQLLTFARKQVIEPKVMNLNRAVSQLFSMLKRLIGEDITIQWRPGHDLWSVRMDPSQLDQILANLCINARDAISDVGKIVIETENCIISENYRSPRDGFIPGEYVRLAVSDNGCGMDKKTRHQIFEPFFTTKETGKGTGLGLATVFGAVKQNDGFVYVYSEPGMGTTFSIYFPKHQGDDIRQGEVDAALPVPRGNETILLVEDESTVLDLASLFLTGLGYTVLTATTPVEAISLAREYAGKIQLVLTDIVLPEMNGLELTKKLLSLYPHLKRMYMSGYSADVIAHRGVLDDRLCFLHKPFELTNLAAKVREVLDSDRGNCTQAATSS